MLRRLLARCVRALGHSARDHVLAGGGAAICLATICQQIVVSFGTSPTVSLSLLMAVIIGLASGIAFSRPAAPEEKPHTELALLWLALAAWMIGTPWLLEWADRLVSHPRFLSPSEPLANAFLMFTLFLGVAGIPAWLSARLATRATVRRESDRTCGWQALGAAGGLTLWGFALAQILGPWLCAVVACGPGLAVATWRLLRTPPAPSEEGAAIQAEKSAAFSRAWGRSPGIGAMFLDAALAVGCGASLFASMAILEQLMPGTVYFSCAAAIGVALGVGLVLLVPGARKRRGLRADGRKLLLVGSLALCGVLLVGSFPVLIKVSLAINAFLAAPWLALAARGVLVALFTIPFGCAIGSCLAADATDETMPIRTGVRAWLICAVAGYAAGAWAIDEGIHPATVVVALASGLLACGAVRYAVWRHLPETRRTRWIAAAGAAIVLASPTYRSLCDFPAASRLLFNTNVFVAYRAGFGASLLPCLDEGRHVATFHGARGSVSSWKYGGAQLQLRKNGMPSGIVSCDTEVFPRFLPEGLQTVLPLVLHEKPKSLLLLGLGSGEPLLVGLAFPLPDIACWEPDTAHVRMIREVVGRQVGYDPLDGERVRLTTADPALALDAEERTFDAIVSCPEHVALLRAQSAYTQQYYRRVARRLSPQGVFCQRLSSIDLGPRPVQTIVATMQSVFRDVMAVEAAPGEMLLAATNDPEGLLQAKLVDRLQLPHVRGLLAQSGLDWSVLLNIPSCRQDGLATFVGTTIRRPNRAEDSRLTFSLPREVMRWADKPSEMHRALGPHSSRILSWVGEEEASAEVLRRLAEVTAQQKLMARYTDQYQSYRASLRMQVTKQSRGKIASKIQRVSASDDKAALHPEDARRLKYFVALSKAIGSRKPADIERLAAFAIPYDPMLSYFVHLEAAELYARSEPRDALRELQHRLHAVWYSSPRDSSLRNVVAALRLLRESPEAQADPGQRWDTLSALLQALQQRWEARSGTPSDVKRTIEEADETVLAAEQTFEAMEALTREAGLPPELWKSRQRVLERTLVRRVKAHRSELLPLLHNLREKAEVTAEEAEDEVDSADGSEASDGPE